MKTIFLSFILLTCLLMHAQTQGTLTLSFTQTPHTSYQGTKNVMAVWIQTSTGAFVKTRARNAGGGTSDHLAVWAVNSGGSASNCMSANCNTVGGTTGATLTNFATRTFTWDGTDASGNNVPDGTYKITVESTWNHGSAATTTRSYTFVKGTSADVQTPTADANFTAISLAWNPATSGLESKEDEVAASIHPNPSMNGVFTVDFNKATKISVTNLAGEEVLSEAIKPNELTKTVNLTNMPNGVYFICVWNGTSVSKNKVVIEK